MRCEILNNILTNTVLLYTESWIFKYQGKVCQKIVDLTPEQP